MEVLGLFGGIVVGGIVGVLAKDKIMGSSPNEKKQKNEIDTLCDENEKLSKRNKELERQVEDLLSELGKVRKQAQNADDDHDALEDDFDRAKKELKSIRMQNEELVRKIKEYKTACESQEAEIAYLKEKLN